MPFIKTRTKIQQLGGFLSNMVQPNIGAFIAWGLITAFFIPTGWIPSKKFALLVGPMINYMLPLLIAYSGGELIYKKRGGVIAVISTMGMIIGAAIPMFLGAMIIGPLSAYAIKYVDKALKPVTPGGFEMLINNFSIGIVGAIIALFDLFVMQGVIQGFTNSIGLGAQWLLSHKLLPFIAFIVEPAKVLFLNNAINHGVFTPLGTEEVVSHGKSLFFLIEANPGSGAGMLLAYFFFVKDKKIRQGIPATFIIHFFGGIHEVYFPYILMKPKLIFAMIGGGITNVLTLIVFHGGLVGPASPGSVFAIYAMTPKGMPNYIANTLAILFSGVVAFLLSAPMLRFEKAPEQGSLEDFKSASAQMKKAGTKSNSVTAQSALSRRALPSKVTVVCDAGMGSSAFAAARLRKIAKKMGLTDVNIVHAAVDQITQEDEFIITIASLAERAREVSPSSEVHVMQSFTDMEFYEGLVRDLLSLVEKEKK